ncbi:alpha/beta-hydrolases superfamily protein [Anaeramoeba ignava]|uniref:Alpha/beta-hydrolases superfamily protein n=1 Tax=Anaeramoeba ignava TaxID=1746090 RepID=A0A9Q0LEM7_ANAIG|nr:alpha/beta-hydrolases superfamily protein [Anaeramoeba ignava]
MYELSLCIKKTCSETNTYQSAEAAYDYVINDMGVPPQQVILFGYSLGTGPTLYLASNRECGGVILMSSIISCMKTVVHKKFACSSIDIFPNLEMAKKVQHFTLVIHGIDDKTVKFENGKQIYYALPNTSKPLWIEGANHLNIVSDFPHLFYPQISQFIRDINNSKNSKNSNNSKNQVLLKKNIPQKNLKQKYKTKFCKENKFKEPLLSLLPCEEKKEENLLNDPLWIPI